MRGPGADPSNSVIKNRRKPVALRAQAHALGLALNAVVHWNAIYMQEAIRQVRSDSMDVSNDDIAHLSPLIWRHLNFLGRYDLSLPDTVMNGGLRPLRNPTSAWDF